MRKILLIMFGAMFLICPKEATSSLNIDEKWFGSYDLEIVYAEGTEEIHGIVIGYSVTINKDKCEFLGVGFQTYFEIPCQASEQNGKLVMRYIRYPESDNPTEEISIMSEEDGEFFIESPSIYDNEGNPNTKFMLQKN